MEKASCITINCGCCGGGTGNSGVSTPVGTVISYMGTKVPQHYLVCDGAELNIADYPQLSQQIQEEFGAVDYFGGDGTATFAVPDLRNEFLRGYHGEAGERLSEEIGKHQNPTMFPDVGGTATGNGNRMILNYTASDFETKGEGVRDAENYSDRKRNGYITSKLITSGTDVVYGIGSYAGRPANVAVLYCIKYE